MEKTLNPLSLEKKSGSRQVSSEGLDEASEELGLGLHHLRSGTYVCVRVCVCVCVCVFVAFGGLGV